METEETGLFSFERRWRQHFNHNLELSWPSAFVASFIKFDAIGKPRIAIIDFVADIHHNGVIVMTVCSNAQVSFHISLSSDWSCCRGKLVATRVGKTCIANIPTVCTQHTHIHTVRYHPHLVRDYVGKISKWRTPLPQVWETPVIKKKLSLFFTLEPQEHVWSSPKNHNFK